jgi:protein TonB
LATAFTDFRPLDAVPARAALALVPRSAPRVPSYASYASSQRRIRWPLVVALGVVHALVAVVIALDSPAMHALRRTEPIAVSILREAPKPPPPERPPKPLPVKRIAPLPVVEPPPVVLPDLPRVVELPTITLPPDPPRIVTPAPVIVPSAPVAAAPPGDPLVAPRFDAAYLDNPAPAYPSTSRRQHEEGRVLLRVRVGADGRAESVEIATSSGYDRLDRAAQDAVRRWRFEPARRGTEAVAAYVNVPIAFSLDRA